MTNEFSYGVEEEEEEEEDEISLSSALLSSLVVFPG